MFNALLIILCFLQCVLRQKQCLLSFFERSVRVILYFMSSSFIVKGRSFENLHRKNIALIAHDSQKETLLEWSRHHHRVLSHHCLFATATTGGMLEKSLGLKVHKFKSGPLGGDQQIGARIVEGGIDCLIFFWDALAPHPHDVDVKALIRIAVVYNLPIAINPATADFMVASKLMRVGLLPDPKDRA